jgi:hypothetical protein
LPAFGLGATPPEGKEYQALYDTGATHTCISPRVVDEIKLASFGATNVGVGGGDLETTTHLVNIGMPNRVMFPMMRVAKVAVEGSSVLSTLRSSTGHSLKRLFIEFSEKNVPSPSAFDNSKSGRTVARDSRNMRTAGSIYNTSISASNPKRERVLGVISFLDTLAKNVRLLFPRISNGDILCTPRSWSFRK